ncbi:MAG: energy transducer TonB [Campylobacterales bacterium]|nr:energy transducer TonB [Campylobacterales bacterium]
MTKRLERRSFMASFALHGAVFVGYLVLMQTHHMHANASAPQTISMQINMVEYTEPAPIVHEFIPPPPPPKEIIKPAEPPKPVVKKEIPKPVVKPKPKPVVKEAPVIPMEPEVIEAAPQEVAHETSTEVSKEPLPTPAGPPLASVASPEAALVASAAQQFVQTNFTIIRDMVLRNLVYPNIARRMGQTGVVEMTLVIDKRGRLLEYFVSKSSDSSVLDGAAMRAVERVAKADFPKPKTTSTIILPIGFRLN